MTLRLGPIGPSDDGILEALFAKVAADPTAARFHPHPFTTAEARVRAGYTGKDVYALLTWLGAPIAYGLLRGWDAGYNVPSLGIYVVPEWRGAGLSSLLMEYLHANAKLRGAPAIRLKVYADNTRARRLYERLGYHFTGAVESNQLVGRLELG